jgi:L-ascorbate metabolism protein UlaG (beta-lactamase superfamily)
MIRRASLFLAPLCFLAACNNPAPATTAPAPASASAAPSAAASVAVVADAAPPKPAPVVTDTLTTPAGEMTVTPIHHATLLLRVAGKAIYVDPVAQDASYEGLPKADYVFVTDIHGDHMDPGGLAKVKKDDSVVVGPPAVNEKMPVGIVMKNGETHDFGTFKVEAVPMYNLTRGPSAGKLFHDKGRGNGYVFSFGKAGPDSGATASRVYISGDTECTPEMKALKNIDVAFVCMNLPYTMPPTEAATCVNAFKPKILFPFHYRGSSLDELTAAIKAGSGIEVRKREWY